MNDLSDQAVHFGPYRIHPRQRLVLEAGRPLRLGRRAVDILLILLEQAGNVVSKQELIARVWPRSVVEDGNLRVHMAALRKALGDGQAGQRYIVTVAQRGYSFVAPLSIEPMTLPTEGAPQRPCHNLPLRRTRMLGRQALIDSLVQQLPEQRFITLTGAGHRQDHGGPAGGGIADRALPRRHPLAGPGATERAIDDPAQPRRPARPYPR